MERQESKRVIVLRVPRPSDATKRKSVDKSDRGKRKAISEVFRTYSSLPNDVEIWWSVKSRTVISGFNILSAACRLP